MTGGFENPFATAGQMGNLNGATVFGEGTIQHGVLHFDTGARLGRGHSGRGGQKNSDGSDDSDASGASLLQFDSLNGVSSGAYSSGTDQDTEILDANFADALASPDGAYDPGPADMGYDPAMTPNLQPGMFSGNMFFRPHRGGFGSGFGGGALGGRGFGGAGRSGGSAFAGAGSGNPGTGHREFGPAGHFVFNTFNVAAVVRVNLDRPAQTVGKKPTLTAVGIDPQSGEAWVAIGSELIHLAKDGSQLGSYQIATPDGTPLYPDAILVEPDRLLLADDPLGIFSFARPDRGAAQPGMNVTAEPTQAQVRP